MAAASTPPMDYLHMPMEQLKGLAEGERVNQAPVGRAAKLWAAIHGQVLTEPLTTLTHSAGYVREHWLDSTRAEAFDAPIEAGIQDIRTGIDLAEYPLAPLNFLFSELERVPNEVARLYEAWKIQNAIATQPTETGSPMNLDANSGPINLGTPAPTNALPIQAAAEEAERLRMEAAKLMIGLGAAYNTAKTNLEVAARAKWTGPTAANGNSPRTTAPGGPGGPGASPQGGGPSGAQPGGQQGGGAQQGGAQQGGAQQGGAQQGGAQQGGAGQQPAGGAGGSGGAVPGDTGLSGAPAPTVPSPTTPNLPGPSPTVPTTPTTPNVPGPVPVGGGGFGGSPGLSGLGAARTGGTSAPGSEGIQQAARQLGTAQSGSSGQAPTLAGLGRGAGGTQSGAGLGGVPPMMPPMAPGAGGGGGSSRPKPGTAQAASAGRNRSAGPTAGVPAGLLGRADKSRAQRAANRHSRRDGSRDGERLDSEMWDVNRND